MKYRYTPYNAKCPICGNVDNVLLYEVNVNEAAIHFLVTHGLKKDSLKLIEEKITNLWTKKSAAIISCSNCHFAFTDPFVSGDNDFYNLLPHAISEDNNNWKWEFDKTLKKVADLALNNENLALLEIGASTGGFVKKIATVIKKENILCLEHSLIGLNSIKKAGIEAHGWDFRELGHDQKFFNKFDIICLFQVLEHLDKLDETFKTFNLLIKPGGHLFIGVPNGQKINFNELNGALLDMPPNHIGRFNKLSFKFLSDKYGWEIAEIATEPYTPLDVMKTVLYYRSLKEAQSQRTNKTLRHKIKQYMEIKYIRLQAYFMHKQLGETLWVHLVKGC